MCMPHAYLQPALHCKSTAARLHLPGCLDCPVNVLLLSLCHLDQHLASARVLRLKSLPAGGVHKLAINEQLHKQSEDFITSSLLSHDSTHP